MSSRVKIIQVIWEILVIWVIGSDNDSDAEDKFGNLGDFGNFRN